MKRFTIVLMTCAFVISAAAQVTPEEHAAHHPPQASSTPGMPDDMHQHMKGMQALMQKIEKTSDPGERQRLLDQHRKAMHDQLDSMMHLRDGMGMEMGMGKSGDMMECHERMQAQMDMMTGMMDQLMRHEDAARGMRRK